MSRQIDFDKPLSDEDKRYLHEWSQDWRIAENERRFGKNVDLSVPVDTDAVLAKAGVEVPPPPPGPSQVAGPVLSQGSEGFHQNRDHPLTGVVDEEPVEEVDIDELTVEELRAELHDLGEPTTGNKAELQKRLAKALKD
jgi:SAP domain